MILRRILVILLTIAVVILLTTKRGELLCLHYANANRAVGFREDDIVFSRDRLCVCVCLFVNTITLEPSEISSRHFQGIILWSKGDRIGMVGW